MPSMVEFDEQLRTNLADNPSSGFRSSSMSSAIAGSTLSPYTSQDGALISTEQINSSITTSGEALSGMSALSTSSGLVESEGASSITPSVEA